MNIRTPLVPFRSPRPPRHPFPSQNSWPRPAPLLSESLLLPPWQQSPPMFGRRGATIPSKFYTTNTREQMMQSKNDVENESSHWCETCDRGFKTQTLLENHTKEHQRCNIDGCVFIAHPKVITKHIQMQHSSGLYNKISKLNDPKEIEKWREERRRKFPTKANIEIKNAAVKEKIERGEKMGLQKKKFPGDSNNQRGNTSGIRKRSNIMRRRPKKIEKACPAITAKHSLPAFTGISNLIIENEIEENTTSDNTDFLIDDEMDSFTDGNHDHRNMTCGAITQLIADYGSSDEDCSVNVEINKNQISGIKSNIMAIGSDMLSNQKFDSCKIIDKEAMSESIKLPVNKDNSDDSGPEEVKTEKIKEDITPVHSKTEPSNDIVKSSKAISSHNESKPKVMKRSQNIKRKLPSTLLEKLLSNEIRHERNIMLQCIRYVIKNNYFDKTSPS